MTDYCYASARLSVLEGRLPLKAKLEKWQSATDEAMLIRMMGDSVTLVKDADGRFLREETLDKMFRDGIDVLRECVGDKKALSLFDLPYDCNNVKMAIKAVLQNKPVGRFAVGGRLTPEQVAVWQKAPDALGLPPALTEAVNASYEKALSTGLVGMVDYVMDTACYRDMLTLAKETGSAWLVGLVKLKIDLTNVLTVLRLFKLGGGARALLDDAFIEGGNIEQCDFEKTKTTDDVFALTVRIVGGEHFNRQGPSLVDRAYALERLADDTVTAYLSEARFNPIGLERVVAFRLTLETAVKNCRILLAGKKAGLTRGEIEERLRGYYV